MIFCGKRRKDGVVEFSFKNEQFKYMCTNTKSYFLGIISDSDDINRIDGIFWLNHYQFEILWELDQISNRQFLRPIEKGMRKLYVQVEENKQPTVGILGKLSMLRAELEMDECPGRKGQKELAEMIELRLSHIDNMLMDAKVKELYYHADVFLLQGDDNQKHKLRSEQMSLVEFSQKNEVSPFV